MKTKCSGIQKIKFSKCSKMCENTWFFFIPVVLSLLSRMFIEPLIHSECLVCTWFQALVVWHFCMHSRVYAQTQLLTQTFCKVGSWKILEKSLPEKVYELTLSLTFHTHSIATNHLYNCQQRQCMRISILIFLLTIIQKSVHLWRDIVNPYFLSDRNIQIGTSSIVQN